MSKQYDQFKKNTIDATQVITAANNLKAVSDEYTKGFNDAMWEAREIYIRLEPKGEQVNE